MFGDKSPFRAFYPSYHTLVTADKKRHTVPAEGPAMLKAIDVSGRMQHISIGKALHCPGMHDLLSCSGILDAGGIVHLENGNSYIKLKSNAMFPVQYRGRLFYLDSIERPNGTKPPRITLIMLPVTMLAPVAPPMRSPLFRRRRHLTQVPSHLQMKCS